MILNKNVRIRVSKCLVLQKHDNNISEHDEKQFITGLIGKTGIITGQDGDQDYPYFVLMDESRHIVRFNGAEIERAA